MRRIGFFVLAGSLLLAVDAGAQPGAASAPWVAAPDGQSVPPGPARQGWRMGGRGRMLNMSRMRHHYVRRNGFDSKYAPMRNPFYATDENVAAGQQIFSDHCQTCHGVQGLGDGEGGKGLNPLPSNIARFAKTTMATDSYLMWTISEGGAPIGTAMPAYKSVLKEDDIWKVILYLRKM